MEEKQRQMVDEFLSDKVCCQLLPVSFSVPVLLLLVVLSVGRDVVY